MPEPTVPGPPPLAFRERLRARFRAHFTFGNVVSDVLLLLVLVWAAPRLLPHLGALVGVGSGPDMAPRYEYATLDGRVLGSDSLRGKVVLVNFWATWCLPCRAEMPLLDQMQQRHANAGLVILGLAVDRASTASVRAFVEERGITYPIAHVGPEAEQTFGGVRGYPTSFLIDRTGRIRHTVLGPIAPLSLEPAVRRLLAEPSP